MKAILEKGELKTLETEFAAALEEATTERKHKRVTPPTFAKNVAGIIRDQLKEFEKRSDGLFKPLDVNALHDLRIAAKRLRYAIELLGPCFPRSISMHAKRAARLQTALGDLHDCDSWIVSLGEEIAPARKEKATEKVAAFMWLLTHFAMLRAKHLHRAFARWCEWEAHDSSGKLRAAVTTQKPAPTELAAVEKLSTTVDHAAAQHEIPSPETDSAQAVGETDAAGLVTVQ